MSMSKQEEQKYPASTALESSFLVLDPCDFLYSRGPTGPVRSQQLLQELGAHGPEALESLHEAMKGRKNNNNNNQNQNYNNRRGNGGGNRNRNGNNGSNNVNNGNSKGKNNKKKMDAFCTFCKNNGK